MEEVFAILLMFWVGFSTIVTIDNMLNQTPDKRIITQCKEAGYITINQTVVSCSIEKEIKK